MDSLVNGYGGNPSEKAQVGTGRAVEVEELTAYFSRLIYDIRKYLKKQGDNLGVRAGLQAKLLGKFRSLRKVTEAWEQVSGEKKVRKLWIASWLIMVIIQ